MAGDGQRLDDWMNSQIKAGGLTRWSHTLDARKGRRIMAWLRMHAMSCREWSQMPAGGCVSRAPPCANTRNARKSVHDKSWNDRSAGAERRELKHAANKVHAARQTCSSKRASNHKGRRDMRTHGLRGPLWATIQCPQQHALLQLGIGTAHGQDMCCSSPRKSEERHFVGACA